MPHREQVLDRRALNRALLARQLLLERRRGSAAGTIEHLVGMQAQAPNLPYVGLWARLVGFRPDELSRQVEARQAIRLSLMRNTIHLVTRRDALGVKPLFMRLGERGFLRGSPWGRQMRDADMVEIARAGREIMGEKPRTVAELARIMAWLGQAPGPAIAEEDFVLRYLKAFGPASVADMRAWSGLAMRAAFERLRPRLRVFRDPDGRELFDLPRAPRPPAELEVPVRFLPDYDNILLGHADRTRILAPGRHLGLFSSNGIMKGSVLVDGFVRGAWIPTSAMLHITPFDKPFSRKEARDVAGEGLKLMEFLAPGEKHDLSFGPVKL
ncbi:MAG: winged helix DNA-binding domain-containing protein [Chloroflexi bacterium]|nr:MAG: winged helix DNA-binding domain-containing protein [Chloroflexota bacterium]